jgi:type IV secretion system protein VirB10
MTIAAAPSDIATVERDPRPIVAAPRRGASGAAIAALGLLAAILLFVTLNAQRQQAQAVSEADRLPVVYAPPPPLSIPVEPVVRPQPIPVVAVQPVALAAAPPPAPPPPPERIEMPPPQIIRQFAPPQPIPLSPRQSGPATPALVVDSGGGDMAIGTLIPAVLETPIDTSRPGMVRAIVSQDARGQDNQKVLVPRGSRLIGEYQSDVRSGQNRVLVNWTRLVRPDGTAVRLGAPSADSTGGAGIPGEYHSFFLSRFFNAALQTALTVGGNLIGGQADNTVIVGVPGALGSAGQGLISTETRRPKITVEAGTLFNVFVNREIDFSGTTPPQ